MTGLYDELRGRVEARLKTFKSDLNDEEHALGRELARIDTQVERLVAFVRNADVTPGSGAFDTLRASLDKAANEQRRVRAQLETIRRKAKSPPRLPTTDEIVKLVTDVTSRFKDDPIAAREQLRRMMEGGVLRMHPLPDGSYRAESSVFLLKLPAGSRKPRKGLPSGASEVVEIDGCAGVIRSLYHECFPRFLHCGFSCHVRAPSLRRLSGRSLRDWLKGQ